MNLKRPSVLILEDDESILESLQEGFEARDFDVLPAVSPNVVFDKLSNSNLAADFDVVILDMAMEKGPDGGGVGRFIKEKCSSNPPAFIVHTGFNDKLYRVDAMKLDAEFLLKGSRDSFVLIRLTRVLTLKQRLLRLNISSSIHSHEIETIHELLASIISLMAAILGNEIQFLITESRKGTQLHSSSLKIAEPSELNHDELERNGRSFDGKRNIHWLKIYYRAGVRVTLGIVEDANPMSDSPIELLKLITIHCGPIIFEHILRIKLFFEIDAANQKVMTDLRKEMDNIQLEAESFEAMKKIEKKFSVSMNQIGVNILSGVGQ